MTPLDKLKWLWPLIVQIASTLHFFDLAASTVKLKFVSTTIVSLYIKTFQGLPNEQGRLDILKIHSRPIATHGEIDFESVVKLSDGFNGADLRNVCTEAGLFAIRDERDFVNQEDMMKAVRKVADAKRLESKLDYKPV